jgi:hypothetical protein
MQLHFSLKPILEKINFAERYRNICDQHSDFENRIRGNQKKNYDDILTETGYHFEYFKKEHFYRIVTTVDKYEFGLQLILKDGLVESMIDIKKGDTYLSPGGRLDFLPEDMGIRFERKRFNLPMYTSESELEEILKEIFSLYEDIKREVLKAPESQA